MTRSEILKIAKPILFNGEMVRAILDGRKTVTRRVIKVNFREGEAGYNIVRNAYTGEFCYLEVYDEWESEARRIGQPYLHGDYLYVRETWCKWLGYHYRVDDGTDAEFHQVCYDQKWKPSIHMPKEAARIFLRVTGTRVERVREITEEGVISEGCHGIFAGDGSSIGSGWEKTPIDEFAAIWDSTIPPKDRDKYGWAANPWVWVIAFKRVEVTE